MELWEEKEIINNLNDIKNENFKAYVHIKNIISLMCNKIKNEKE